MPDGYVATGPTTIPVTLSGTGDQVLTIDFGFVPNVEIPRTGGDPSTMLRLGAMLALFGLGLFLLARRRRDDDRGVAV